LGRALAIAAATVEGVEASAGQCRSLPADGGEASTALPRGAAAGAAGGQGQGYPTSAASVEDWLSQLDLGGYDDTQFFLVQYAQHLN
jgi:hypothetical protein